MPISPLPPRCCRCSTRLYRDRQRGVYYCANAACSACDPPRPGRNSVLVLANSHPAWGQRCWDGVAR